MAENMKRNWTSADITSQKVVQLLLLNRWNWI